MNPPDAELYERVEEMKVEIHRLKTEGLNADQEDKTDWEDYIDTIAGSRRIAELEKEIAQIENPKPEVYTTLEEILQDIISALNGKGGANISQRETRTINSCRNVHTTR